MLFFVRIFNPLVHMPFVVLVFIFANGELRPVGTIVTLDIQFFRVVRFGDFNLNVSKFI